MGRRNRVKRISRPEVRAALGTLFRERFTTRRKRAARGIGRDTNQNSQGGTYKSPQESTRAK